MTEREEKEVVFMVCWLLAIVLLVARALLEVR